MGEANTIDRYVTTTTDMMIGAKKTEKSFQLPFFLYKLQRTTFHPPVPPRLFTFHFCPLSSSLTRYKVR